MVGDQPSLSVWDCEFGTTWTCPMSLDNPQYFGLGWQVTSYTYACTYPGIPMYFPPSQDPSVKGPLNQVTLEINDVLYAQMWAQAQHDQTCHATNGVESQNKLLKYSYLPQRNKLTLSQLARVLHEELVQEMHHKYAYVPASQLPKLMSEVQ